MCLWWCPSRQGLPRGGRSFVISAELAEGPAVCPDPLAGVRDWKQHTLNTCLDFPYTNQSRKMCLDTFSCLERDGRDKKNGATISQSRELSRLCVFPQKGARGEQLKIFYFPVLLDLAQWDINSCMEIFVTSVSCSQGHPNHRTAPGIDLCLKVKSKWKCDSL